MEILAVDGVPCHGIESVEKPVSTAQKVRMLRASEEDFEFYPTTPEIMEAMRKDLWAYLESHEKGYYARRRNEEDDDDIGISESSEYIGKREKKTKTLDIDSFLDIGAGDGRVLDLFPAHKKYGIEIARTQADDLIRRGIFLIGRDYWDVSLNNNNYSLIFSNPPFSAFTLWVNKILVECNFRVLYLVMPVRWKNDENINRELKRYETTVVGEFDFSKADREARGKVNLVRVNAPWEKIDVENKYKYEAYETTVENAFERFVRENIGNFDDKPEREWEEEQKQELALKMTPIDQLLADYETERETLGNAFRAIGKLDQAIIKLMGQDKKSMLEIIKTTIKGLKKKYWRATFDKLEPVQKRMTFGTREKIFNSIKEFQTLDFNADNIYSIIIWIINNTNIGILDQIGEVFDKLTTKDYIEKYVSNKHWVKGDWRNADDRDNWKYTDLPPRWKLGLDYRIVVEAHNQYTYTSQGRRTVVDDFIVICNNLGFPIIPTEKPNYTLHQTEQKFHTEDGELAFTMRYYTGNHNAHLKINKKLLMKFNIEVAKIRKWMSDPDDVVEEYGIPKNEATQLWNSGVALLGSGDVRMLEFKEAV
jgi:hypothetical protein